MGQVGSVGFSAFGFGCQIAFKGDEVSAKQKVEAFLNQTGFSVVQKLRQNDEEIEEFFQDNCLRNLKSNAEIKGWVHDLSEEQATWLIQALAKYSSGN